MEKIEIYFIEMNLSGDRFWDVWRLRVMEFNLQIVDLFSFI